MSAPEPTPFDVFDVFVSHSHAHADNARVVPLVAALKKQGLKVWVDLECVGDGESITNKVAAGLAASKMLLAWYSESYVRSRACQWELTAALIAGAHDQNRRVLVLNPETATGHIQPITLRDQIFLDANDALESLAARIAACAQKLTGRLDTLSSLAPPEWLGGGRRSSSQRFVGRLPDLWAVHSHLQASHAVMVSGAAAGSDVALVQGLGGIGKSLLAEEYALRFGAAYPGGIVWLQGTGDLGSQLGGLAGKLDVPVAGRSPDEVEGAVRRHLAAMAKPYLWIVDDLPPQETVGQWRAPSGNGHTLITTRSTQLDTLGNQHRLGILPPPEALALLTARTPPSVEEKPLAEKIAERLGGHALALDIAGAAVVHVGGYAGFLELLKNPGDDALALAADFVGVLPGNHTPDIATTLLDSIDRLRPEGLLVLQTAALLAPSPIPNELIDDVLAALPGGDAKHGLRGRAATAREALTEAEVHTVSVHVLLSHTIRHHRPSPTAALRAALVTRLRVWMRTADDIRTHATLQPVIAHVRSLTETVTGAEDADLAGRLGHYDHARGAYTDAALSRRKSRDTLSTVQGDEHPDTLISMNNLALTLRAQGDLSDARALQEQVLAVRLRLQGADHPDTLTSMNNLASTLRGQGDLSGARALQEQVLAVQRRVLGAEHPNTLTSMNNLALTLGDQGDLSGARALEEQVLAMRRRVLGTEHPDTLSSMNNLAETLRGQGDLSGARALHEQVLAVQRRVLGEEHPDTMRSTNNLSSTLQAQGDLSGARALQEQVLAVQRRVLGAEHPDTLRSMNNLAGTLRGQGGMSGARALQEQVLAVQRGMLGAEHPDTLTSTSNLALTLWAQGDLSGARVLQELVLAVQRRVLGDEHPATLTSLNNLALTRRDQGDLSGARALGEQALSVRRRVLGSEHPDTLMAMNNLAYTLHDFGNFAAARSLLDEALPIALRTLGAQHRIAQALQNLKSALSSHT
jgi:tetratricopeptide (TPR) repeat protein